MRVHFIAIGGAVMHNLALALQAKGYDVSGSDDEFFEPSKSRLAAHGLLPDLPGWHPDRITTELDAVILGMHATEDNPAHNRARQLAKTIYSFPANASISLLRSTAQANSSIIIPMWPS